MHSTYTHTHIQAYGNATEENAVFLQCLDRFFSFVNVFSPVETINQEDEPHPTPETTDEESEFETSLP